MGRNCRDHERRGEKGNKMKYKVGDRVRIVDKWVEGCRENSEGFMDHWLGQVMTIRSIDSDCYRMKEDENDRTVPGYGWYWYEPSIAGFANEAEPSDILALI